MWPLFALVKASRRSCGPESQRAEVNCVGSKRTGRPYSCSIRLASTSNWSGPTTPTIQPEPKADKRALFDQLTKDIEGGPKGEAITQKKKADKKADEAEAPAAESTEA